MPRFRVEQMEEVLTIGQQQQTWKHDRILDLVR